MNRKEYANSEEGKAARSRARKGAKDSEETKRKKGEAAKIAWSKLETKTKASNSHKKRYEDNPELREIARENLIDRIESSGHPTKGKPLSDDHKKKVGDFFRGKKLTEEHKVKIGKAHKGRQFTTEHIDNIKISKKKHAAEINIECNCWVHSKKMWTNTKPHKNLKCLLEIAGFLFEEEVDFGKYSVDFYIKEYSIAFEADGFFHSFKGREDYDKNRDKFIFDNFGVTVIRLTYLELERIKLELDTW